MSRVLPYNAKQWEIPLLQDGRKTVTRRVVKFPVNKYTNKIPDADKVSVYSKTLRSEKVSFHEEPFYCFDVKPPYQPGDILYVRETVWQKTGHYLDIDGETKAVFCSEFRYVATDEEPEAGWNYSWVKRPSIHMPKEAARIWLKVTDVRVERLQEMDCEDAMKEGIDPRLCVNLAHTVVKFQKLWDSTLKKSDLDRYGWDANPWVWVIEFERCDKPKDWRC